MSSLQKTDVYQSSEVKAARKSDYGFVLVLICLALALVLAGAVFTPTPFGGEIPPSSYIGP